MIYRFTDLLIVSDKSWKHKSEIQPRMKCAQIVCTGLHTLSIYYPIMCHPHHVHTHRYVRCVVLQCRVRARVSESTFVLTRHRHREFVTRHLPHLQQIDESDPWAHTRSHANSLAPRSCASLSSFSHMPVRRFNAWHILKDTSLFVVTAQLSGSAGSIQGVQLVQERCRTLRKLPYRKEPHIGYRTHVVPCISPAERCHQTDGVNLNLEMLALWKDHFSANQCLKHSTLAGGARTRVSFSQARQTFAELCFIIGFGMVKWPLWVTHVLGSGAQDIPQAGDDTKNLEQVNCALGCAAVHAATKSDLASKQNNIESIDHERERASFEGSVSTLPCVESLATNDRRESLAAARHHVRGQLNFTLGKCLMKLNHDRQSVDTCLNEACTCEARAPRAIPSKSLRE